MILEVGKVVGRNEVFEALKTDFKPDVGVYGVGNSKKIVVPYGILYGVSVDLDEQKGVCDIFISPVIGWGMFILCNIFIWGFAFTSFSFGASVSALALISVLCVVLYFKFEGKKVEVFNFLKSRFGEV